MFPTPATTCWFISAAFTEPFLPSKRSRKEAGSSSRESGPSFFFRTKYSRSSIRSTLPNIRWSSKARWYPLSKEIRNLSCGGSRSRSSKYSRSPVMPKCMSSQPPPSSATKRFLPWRRVDSKVRPFRVLCSSRTETPPRIFSLLTSTDSIFWWSEVESVPPEDLHVRKFRHRSLLPREIHAAILQEARELFLVHDGDVPLFSLDHLGSRVRSRHHVVRV